MLKTIFLLLTILSITSCGGGDSDSRQHQAAFTKAVSKYAAEFKTANDLRKPELRAERKAAVLAAVPNGEVINWTGKVKFIRQVKGGGLIDIAFADAPCILRNHPQAYIASGTPEFDLLKTLKVGDDVTFSGLFYPEEEDGFNEISFTGFGSMMEPEYAFAPIMIGKESHSVKSVKVALADKRAEWRAAEENLAKALAAVQSESKVKEAAWQDDVSPFLVVGVIDEKSSRGGYAEYLCSVIRQHGVSGGKVWIMDASTSSSLGKMLPIDQAMCPEQ